jgi:predicted HTH transcriptional regulator
MTLEDLKKGESESIEFKKNIPADKDKFLKTAVAFANGAGGRIIFGVENNSWNVTGFPDDEVFQKYDAIANSIFDTCTPAVVPIMSIEEIDNRKIIVAEIRSGMAKPYYLRSEGMMAGTYIRVAGVTRKAEPYMIKELQLEGCNRSFDTTQVVGEITLSEINSLCERMYQHALARCKSDEQRTELKNVSLSQLVSWKIVVQSNGRYFPTNAWHLLTGDFEDLIPDAYIQLAAFKGNTRSIFLDKQDAKGPIDMQIEEAMIFVKKHINLGSRIDGKYREDFYELPIDSIREMISNAVCHRSYLSPGTIQVAIYDDRLEVTSPRRLSSDLTIEQIIAGNSRIQNSAIGAAFFYMHIIEKWGSGIPRIFEDSKQYGLGVPEIKDFGSSFRISIRRKAFTTDPLGVLDPSLLGKGENKRITLYEDSLSSDNKINIAHTTEDKNLTKDAVSSLVMETKALNKISNSIELMREILFSKMEGEELKLYVSIAEFLKSHDVIKTADVIRITQKSRASANRYLTVLVKLGILKPEGDNKGRVYRRIV